MSHLESVAPGAAQVADRFHVRQNLAERFPGSGGGRQAAAVVREVAEPTKRNHALVHGLLAEGRGLWEITRHLGCGLHTVERYDRAATWQESADRRWRLPRLSKLE